MKSSTPEVTWTRRQVVGSLAGLGLAAPFLGRDRGSPHGPGTLRYTSHVPRSHGLYQVFQTFARQVELESDGRLRLEPFMDKVLHGALDGFKAATTGITDYTHGYATYQPGSFRLLHALQLPFIFPNPYVASLVSEELYPQYFKQEYERMGVYLAHCDSTSPYNIVSRRPIHRLEDLAGVKIRVTGGLTVRIFAELGAVPVVMAAAEVYPAFQRGVVDAVALGTPDLEAYRLYEVGPYFTHVAINVTLLQYCLNKRTFDSLGDLKELFYRLLRQRSQIAARDYYGGQEAEALASMVREGVEVIELGEEERARWRDAVLPIEERFLVEHESRGLPARALVRDMKALTAHYTAWSPEQIFAHVVREPQRGIIDF